MRTDFEGDEKPVRDVLAFEPQPMSLFASDPSAIAAGEQARMEIMMAYYLATQKPRSVQAARTAIMEECRRTEFAERVFYHKPQGDTTIVGPSVRFVEAMLRCWRNVLVRTTVIFENEDQRRVKVICLDLESNTSYSREIVIGKTIERKNPADREVVSTRTNTKGQTVYIVKATEDELHNKQAAQISKTIRNEGLRLVPADVVDDALYEADKTLKETDAKDPKAALKRIIEVFGKMGITVPLLEAYLGHSLDTVTPDEFNDLRGIGVAMKNEGVTWNEIIGGKGSANDQVAAQTQSKIDKMKDRAAKEKEAKERAVKPAAEAQRLADEDEAAELTTPQASLTDAERQELGDLFLEAQKYFKTTADQDEVSLMADDGDLKQLRLWVATRRPVAKTTRKTKAAEPKPDPTEEELARLFAEGKKYARDEEELDALTALHDAKNLPRMRLWVAGRRP